MFSIVRVEPPPKGFFQKRRVKKGQISPEIYYSRFRGVTVRIISAVYSGNPFFEEQILYAAGGDETVFPKGHTVKNPKIQIPDSTEMLRRYAVERFKTTVKALSEKQKIVMGLSDRNARCQGIAAELIPFGKVRVFTLRPEEYDACCSYTYEKYGESPEILESSQLPADTDFVIAPYGLEGLAVTDKKTVVYSQRESDGGIVFAEDDYDCPVDIMELAGKNYSGVKIAAALFNVKNKESII